jgi:hypothetical protein
MMERKVSRKTYSITLTKHNIVVVFNHRNSEECKLEATTNKK